MHRHNLVAHVSNQAADVEAAVNPVINPIAQVFLGRSAGCYLHAFPLETKMSAPASFTTNFSSGRGGGPEIF